MAGRWRGLMVLVAVVGLSLAPAAPRSGGHLAGRAWAAPLADASSTLVVIDAPRGGNTSTQVEVRGWAADPAARGGTGVDRVEVYLDGEPDAGGTRLGQATYGLQRPDIAAHLGSQQFLLSGFALQTTVAPGPHTVYVYAHPSDQPANEGWTAPKQAAVLAGAGAPQPGTAASAAGGAVTLRSPVLSGSVTYERPGVGANYPPGPADTGGPVYAPTYYGYGLYGGIQPFPDVPQYYASAYAVPPAFDFSLGYGSTLLGAGLFTVPPNYYASSYTPCCYYTNSTPSYFNNYYLPGLRRFGWGSGPIYCPIYTAVVC